MSVLGLGIDGALGLTIGKAILTEANIAIGFSRLSM